MQVGKTGQSNNTPLKYAKSPVETRLFGRLYINSQILVAGARFVLFRLYQGEFD